MTLRINRISANNPDTVELGVRVQEFADLVTDFKICRRIQVPIENVTTLTPVLLQNSFGFQVGGVSIIAANRVDSVDTPFNVFAHWVQLPDGRISVTPVGLTASAKYKIVLEVIERG